MYIPSAFKESSLPRLQAFVQDHPFATLVTCPSERSGAGPFASHVPLLLNADRGAQGVLRGHVARADPQWRHFAPAREVPAIFHGPHAAVSSAWYEEPAAAVPTWNYAAVHVYGRVRLIADTEEALVLLRDMTARFQPEGGHVPLQPPAARTQQLLSAIVAFEIDITRWEGKFKLGQNRSAADRRRIREALRERGGHDDLALAEMMQTLDN
ncbi:MAG: FMN-binding negative transcriptional regulator [Pseudomonadota bacterium]